MVCMRDVRAPALGADVALMVLQALDAEEEPEAAWEQATIGRLDYIIISADLEASNFVLDTTTLREQHDREVSGAGLATNLLAQGEATAIGQVDLAHEQVGHLMLQHLQRVGYPIGETHGVAVVQRGAQMLARRRVSFHHQHMQVLLAHVFPVYLFGYHNPPLEPLNLPAEAPRSMLTGVICILTR